jgi:hypothetical protein
MQTFEKSISNLISAQFPAYYREQGPIFVAFITEYYKWLESSDQSLYYSRNFYDLKDIDTTLETFLVYFKEKYLKNIQLTTETNTRQLVKHALDIYRSKGTERAIDLLFKLVFGSGAEIYYPGQDIFRTSDGRWKKPMYLEVSVNEKTERFAGKQITGLTSGAIAYVEQVVRKNTAGKLQDVLYISAIKGIFQTNEIIVTADDIDLNRERIKVTGSLSSVIFPESGSGEGYSIGDIIEVEGFKGRQGKIRVTDVSFITGILDFELLNGGYAYSNSAQVLVSEKVLRLENFLANSSSNTYLQFNEIITQPKAEIEYTNLLGNTQFYLNDQLFTYHPNNSVRSTGYVIQTVPSSNTAGSILAMITSGPDLNERIYTTSNTVNADIAVSGYTDLTTTANVLAVSSNVNLILSNTNGSFQRNDFIYVSNGIVNTATGTVLNFISSGSNTGILQLGNTKGIFLTSATINNITSGSNASISNVTITIGVHEVSNNPFTDLTGNFITSNTLSTNGTIRSISEGSGATFSVDSNLLYPETVSLNSDLIGDYVSVALDSQYGFPQEPTANLNTIIDDALAYDSYQIGKISKIVRLTSGSNYNVPPFIVIYEPLTVPFAKQDLILTVSGTTGNFQIGEAIKQSNTVKGIVKSANSSILFLERLNLFDEDTFILTSNNFTKIEGVNSGSQANIVLVDRDYQSNTLGFNAVLDVTTTTGNGSITKGEVVDSGFGYINNEEITFGSGNNFGTAVAKVETMGTSQGFYQIKGGFLSDQKKLFDGEYYQEYSYEIRSSITLNKYVDMLRNVLHVAGTKYFANFVHRSDLDSQLNVVSGNTVTIS